MKKLLLTGIIICASVGFTSLQAQTIWTGPKMTFTKAPGADFTQAANQDRITSNVWITRGNNMGIYNIAIETSYSDTISPEDTEWAMGTTANIGSLTFEIWEDAILGNPPGSVNQDMVLHLITDDIYIDIKFLSWGQGSGGQGAFSYERSTASSTISLEELEKNNAIKLYPNPTTDFLTVEIKAAGNKTVQLVDITGAIVKTATMSGSELKLDVSGLAKGTYVLSVTTENNRFNKQVVIK